MADLRQAAGRLRTQLRPSDRPRTAPEENGERLATIPRSEGEELSLKTPARSSGLAIHLEIKVLDLDQTVLGKLLAGHNGRKVADRVPAIASYVAACWRLVFPRFKPLSRTWCGHNFDV
jgi:hypothetical protein